MAASGRSFYAWWASNRLDSSVGVMLEYHQGHFYQEARSSKTLKSSLDLVGLNDLDGFYVFDGFNDYSFSFQERSFLLLTLRNGRNYS